MNLKKRYLLFFMGLMLAGGLWFGNNQNSIKNVQAAEISAPTFNKQSGCYDSGFSLELKAATGNKIYYTTDGSIPEVPAGNGSTEPSRTVFEIPAEAESTKFIDGTIAQNVNDGVKLDFAYKYKSISFLVPAGKENWSSASKLIIEYTVNNYRNGMEFKLQVCPVFVGANSSYQENGISTRAFDYQNVSVSGMDKKILEIDLESYADMLSNIGYLMIGNATNNPNDNINENKDSITVHSIKVTFGNGHIPKKETAKEFTGQILIKDRQGEENVLCSEENVSAMYGSEQTPFYPNKNDVAKATVIRAIAVDGLGNRSDVITKTYLVGNDIYNQYKNASVISITTDPDNLLNKEKGIYRAGNYQNKGSDWERDAFVEYFEEDGTIPFATTMGIRIHGGYSRHYGQKSFNLYFREELGGLKNLKNYELIPGNTNFEKTESINKYKHFMLRNGGNDTDYTKLQDVFIQSLVTDRAYSTQSNRACVLFLNGEYWGPYSLMEKYSDNYVEENFGVNKDNVIIIKNGGLDEGFDSDMQYYYELNSFAQKDMKNSENYLAFCDLVDIQSFADYYATEAYIGNKDWPHNNIQLWRCRNAEVGNKYADTKWRWMLFDTEYSMNLYHQTGNDFDGIENAKANSLFQAIIQNQEFQKLFVNTMMDLYNVNFVPNTTDKRLEEYIEIYRPLMGDYYKRFGGEYRRSFDNNIDRIQSFMYDRRNNMLWYLNNHFNTDSAVDVNLVSSLEMKELITVNTTKPNMESGSWTGKYFRKYPIVLKANVPTGYQFDGWEVTGGSVDNASNMQATVTLTSSSVTIKAKYTVISVVTPTPVPTPIPPMPTSVPTQTPPMSTSVPTQTPLMPTSVPTQIPPTPTPGSTSIPSQAPTPSQSPTKNIISTPKPKQIKNPPAVSSAPSLKKITVSKVMISSLKSRKKKITVKYKKITKAKGYEVVYATDKKFKKARKRVLIRTSMVTLKKLQSKKTYYIKVRAYKIDSKGKKIYGKYSIVKSKKVK